MHQFPEAIQKLFSIYSSEFPEFLIPFINTPEIQRLGWVGQNCWANFTNFFKFSFTHTRLFHSIWVALIIWNFTKDPKQTLAGLFHDISHTAFSHVGDFIRGDHEKQESSEVFHDQIISNSAIIMNELEKLWISFEEVNDCTLYPIADNPGPQLAADRLEYNLSDPIALWWDIALVKKLYDNLVVVENEYWTVELGFGNKEIALEFAHMVIDNDAEMYSSYESKLCMSFLSSLLKQAFDLGLFTLEDLYILTDEEVLLKLEHSWNKDIIEKLLFFRNMRYYKVWAKKPQTDEYCIDSKIKRRYINPLVKDAWWTKRLSALDNSFKLRAEIHKNKVIERITINHKAF